MFGSDDCSADRHTTSALAPTELGGVNPIFVATFRHLSWLTRHDLEAISAAGTSQLVSSGHVFFPQGQDVDDLYILLDGEVRLERRRNDVLVARHAVVGPYSSFGDRMLLGETVRYFSARAACKSLIVRLPAAPVEDTLAVYPWARDAWITDILTRPHHEPASQTGMTSKTMAERFHDFFHAA